MSLKRPRWWHSASDFSFVFGIVAKVMLVIFGVTVCLAAIGLIVGLALALFSDLTKAF
jgi:hypothetical protein